MGITYIEPDKVDSTLKNIVRDPRLPGGDIDTEYVDRISPISTGDAKHTTAGGNGAKEFSSSYPGTTNENTPTWLRQENSPKSHPSSPKRLCL